MPQNMKTRFLFNLKLNQDVSLSDDDKKIPYYVSLETIQVTQANKAKQWLISDVN